MRGAAVIACLTLTALTGCGGGSDGLGGVAVVEMRAGPVEIPVEVASTQKERERGLSGRDELAAGTGMAFVFERDVEEGGLWMKDTRMPLSAAFVDAQGNVTALVEMEPCSADPCPVYRPPGPYRLALELAGGELARLGVRVGDRISLRPN